MVLLVLIVVLPEFLNKKAFPKQFQPLYVFFLIAILSVALAYLRELPSFRTIPVWRNAAEGLVTLLFGFGFYLVTIYCLNDQAQIRTAVRWINLGGIVIILSAVVQFFTYKIMDGYPEAFENFQRMVSISVRLYNDRATGLAFEPSWLAHQLNMFYIPIWAGLTIKKVSFQKFRLFKFSLENLLLAASCVILFLSKSRIGWLAFLAFTAYLLIRLMDSFRQKLLTRLTSKWRGKGNTKWAAVLFNAIFWIILVLVLVGGLLLAGWVLTRVDPRMVQLFDLQAIKNLGFLGWASRLVFAERIVYWMAGIAVFLQYPIFGVGLGNSGYFIPQTFDSFGYLLTVILRIFVSGISLPNPKNLWVRILAETGIVGFSVFVSWLWSEWKVSRSLEQFSPPLAQAMGLTGQIVLIGLILEGFSLDTFALPYYWMTLGLVVAVQRVFILKQPSPPSNFEQVPSINH
jgi:hypothetical protein